MGNFAIAIEDFEPEECGDLGPLLASLGYSTEAAGTARSDGA